jgi:hypothetical protein
MTSNPRKNPAPSIQGGRGKKPLQRQNLGGGLSCFISEAMLTSPAFRELDEMTTIGIYFIMYANSDPYGCMEAYPTANAMMSHALGGLCAKVTKKQFSEAVKAISEAGLLYSYNWRGIYPYIQYIKD